MMMINVSNIPEWLFLFLIVMASLAGAISILGIVIFGLWILNSWIRRSNSLNMTGNDLTRKILDNNNMDIQIVKSMMYTKYWNHNKKKNTYRLRPWTYKRKSLWTMMEATQQAYATTLRQTNKKTFWLAFRLPAFIGLLGALAAIALIIIPIYISNKELSNFNTKDIMMFSIGVSALLISQSYILVARQYFLKRYALKTIEKVGFTKKELKSIQFIWSVLFYYSILLSILETLKMIIKIIARSNDSKK